MQRDVIITGEADLAKIVNEADREQVRQVMAFSKAVGQRDDGYPARLLAWIVEDPVNRWAWLGLPPRWEEQRADGFPICPRCGEEELYSELCMGWNGTDPRPTLTQCLADGFKCYRCAFRIAPIAERIRNLHPGGADPAEVIPHPDQWVRVADNTEASAHIAELLNKQWAELPPDQRDYRRRFAYLPPIGSRETRLSPHWLESRPEWFR